MADLGSLDHFLERFVLPLAAGGHVEVNGLLGPGVVADWVKQRLPDGTLFAKLSAAMRGFMTHLGPAGEIDALPLDMVALCAVWHNLLAVTHPEVQSRAAMRRTVRSWCEAMLGWVDLPYTRREVALRHAVLGRLAALGRVDTRVTFWAGYADFVGVSPPKTLLAWPSVRRVREDRTRVDLFTLLRRVAEIEGGDLDTDLTSVVRVALMLSPLTDLGLADRPAPFTFAWTPASVNALGDEPLRGAAERMVLRRGVAAVRALEQATLALCRGDASRDVARALLRFHLEMVVTDAMSSRGGASGTGATVPQPLGLDAYHRLGPPRVAHLVGLAPDLLARALPLDPARTSSKEPPSAPLLQRAGFMESRT